LSLCCSYKSGIEWVQALADILHSALRSHSNETCAPIANPPNSVQLDGTPYHTPSYIRFHAVVWECGEGQTDTQMAVTNIHFASAMPHAKCNKMFTLCNICKTMQTNQHCFNIKKLKIYLKKIQGNQVSSCQYVYYMMSSRTQFSLKWTKTYKFFCMASYVRVVNAIIIIVKMCRNSWLCHYLGASPSYISQTKIKANGQ